MKDILFATDGDIDFTGGDLHWGESTGQHMRDILLANKNEYRTSPSSTVGIQNYLGDENPDDLNKDIRVQFAKDGMEINYLKIVNGKAQIDANYRN